MNPAIYPGLGRGRQALTGTTAVDGSFVGLILDCAGTFSLNLASAATLGPSFQCAVYVTSGTVTIDADGAETIQSPSGAAGTFAVTAGQGVWLTCNGAGFQIALGIGLAPSPSATITTDTIQATTSAGIIFRNSSGTQTLSLGVGPSTTATFAGAVTVPNGTAAAPGIRLTSEAHGLYRGSSTILGFAVAGNAAATLAYSSTVTLSLGGAVAANISMDGPAASQPGFFIRSGGNLRWVFRTDAVAESGSDAGAAFQLNARTDAGGNIDVPLEITRAAGGAITLARPTSITGNLTLSSGSNLAMSGAGTLTTGTGLITCNGAIRLNNAAVAATPTATHTITVQDSTGTTYRLLCVV